MSRRRTVVRQPSFKVDYDLSWLDMAWQCHHCEFHCAYQRHTDAEGEATIRQHVRDGHPSELVSE